MNALHTPLELRLPAALAKKLANAHITTIEDLLHHAPRRYYHWGQLTPIRSLTHGQDVTVLAQVHHTTLVANRQGNGVRLEVDLTDGTDTLTATFFAKNHYTLTPHRNLLTPGSTHLFAGKITQYRGKPQLAHPQFEHTTGTQDDIITQHERPIPIYPQTHGLTNWVIQRAITMVLNTLTDTDIPDLIPEHVRHTHKLLTHAQALRKLHHPTTDDDYKKAQHTLRWHEAFTLQAALRARRSNLAQNQSFPATTSHHQGTSARIRKDLPFQLTQAQEDALTIMEADLRKNTPMVRLLQGDVGSGKTIVALLLSAMMADSGYQTAFLVPTEVLAEQHTQSLTRALGSATLPIECLTANTPNADKQRIHNTLANHRPCIIVGTHALLENNIPFTTLGLIIIDEQHRFGVTQRDTLRERFTTTDTDGNTRIPHQLVMTATPIPRTVAMTVFGDIDEVRMTGLPSGRKPIATYVVDAANDTWMRRLWQRADEEIGRGGRVYVVCPRIDAADVVHDVDMLEDPELGDRSGMPALTSVEQMAQFVREHEALGRHRVVTLTSRDSPAHKAQVMSAFDSGEAPILVATTVIEVGVNVADATMMVICDAQQFGLSQLHQLRGRVGRSTRESVCMAVHRPGISPTSVARLQAFASTTDGFELARADLSLRKEGNVLGKEQSGRGSSLRFVSVTRDEDIIEQARQAAQQLLEVEPDLVSYPLLAQVVRELNEGVGAWMEKT